jgi:hypothetical protein
MAKPHRIQRPRTIKVAAFDIAVNTLDRQNRADFGTFDCVLQEMSLSSDFPTTFVEAETMIHELCHAIVWAYGIRTEAEERIVHLLAVGLLQVWRDNPHLIKWIDAKVRSKN